jgi:predicted 3-demethylubiquinone-9 3-methyltransferase (glyoxalase superfamily)
LNNITPFLWFDGNADEAVKFYTGIFPDSEIKRISHNVEGGPAPAGSVLTIEFRLGRQNFIALNGGPYFKFSEAVSFLIDCKDQQEVDYYWKKLLDGGQAMQCGWLKDKYGLAWQVVPQQFFAMITSGDDATTARVMAAMNTMVKFDIAGLEAAFAKP